MIPIDLTENLFHGHAELEHTEEGVRIHRLPSWLRRQFPDPSLMGAESQPAGVRLVMDTEASVLELDLQSTRGAFPGAERARGVVDVVVDGQLLLSEELTGGNVTITDPATGSGEFRSGPPDVVRIPLGEDGVTRRVEIWLPHSENIVLRSLQADLPGDAPKSASDPADDGAGPGTWHADGTGLVRPVETIGPRWVHHGSSISHGSNATSPTGTWPVIVARGTGADLRNLGFSGNALVDQSVARVIRDAPADLISLKLGINVVGGDMMRLRALTSAVHGFLDTIRDGHPTTPLLLISPLHCALTEDTPGPHGVDPQALARGEIRFVAAGDPGDPTPGRLTLRIERDALAQIVESREDPHLHHLDGLALYGEQDEEELPLPDGLHPGSAAHALIGGRFSRLVFGPGGAFAAV